MDSKLTALNPDIRGVQRIEFSLPWPDVQTPEYKPGQYGRWRIDATPAHRAPAYFLPFSQNPSGFALWRKERGEWGRNPWMSLTGMEMQSMMPHIAAARGRVLVCGLGMGLVAYNMAMMPFSHAVGVVEKDPSVIKLFEESTDWRAWSGAQKIIIQEGDAFKLDASENATDVEIDFLYVDIWKNLGQTNALDDTKRIQEKVRAKTVGYWGQELDFSWWAGRNKALPKGPTPEQMMDAYKAFVEETGLPLIGTDNPRYPGLALAAGANMVASMVRKKDPELASRLNQQAFFFVGLSKVPA